LLLIIAFILKESISYIENYYREKKSISFSREYEERFIAFVKRVNHERGDKFCHCSLNEDNQYED
jgi:hypothetical protein